MKNPWKKLSSRVVYHNPWIRVREDKVIHPDGREGIYAIVEIKPSVYIVALSEDRKVWLIDCFRYSTESMSLEIPAGGTDGQEPLTAAKRELQEETGLVAGHWQKIGELDSHNGVCRERAHIFLATDLKQTGSNEQLADGIERSFAMPVDEVYAAISDGRIRDSESIAALHLAKKYLS
jgi:8-oxo-dGTP pyrophosphatase MutT (NUDIX family)